MSQNPYRGEPLGYTQVTSLGTAAALTPPAGATYAVIIPEGADVRWRDDGVAPTATVGVPLYAGVNADIFPGNIATAQFIQVTASSKLNISWYR